VLSLIPSTGTSSRPRRPINTSWPFSSYRVAIPSNERTVRSGNSSFARSIRGPAAAEPVWADVGDHGDAQRPEAGGRLDRLGDGVFVHAIGRHVEGAGADRPGQRLAPFIGHIRDHDPGAHLGEPARVAEPKPPAPPVTIAEALVRS